MFLFRSLVVAVARLTWAFFFGGISTLGVDETIRLWRASTGGVVKVIEDHSKFVNAFAITPDGKSLISGGADHSIRFWQLPSGAYTGSASDPALPVKTVVSFTC